MGVVMLRLSFFGLHGRLVLFVFLVIAPAVILIYYTGYEHHERAIAETQNHALQMAQVINAYQEEKIVQAHQILLTASQLTPVRERNRVACHEALASLRRQYLAYTDFVAAAPNGEIFCHADPSFSFDTPTMVAEEDWFRRSVQIKNFVISRAIMSPMSNEPVLIFGYPVFDREGYLLAVVSAGLRLNDLNLFISRIPLTPGTVATLVDGNGIILTHYPDPEQWIGKHVDISPMARVAIENHGQGTVELVGFDGIARLYSVVMLQYTEQWLYLIVGIPSHEAYGEVDAIWYRNLSWIGGIILFEALVAGAAGNFFVLRPLRILLHTTRQLAHGNWNARVNTATRLGELRPLAVSFNMMADELQSREHRLREAEARYRALVEQIPSVIYTVEFNPARTTYISPRIESLLGVPAERLIGLQENWKQYIHPDDLDRVRKEFRRVRDSALAGEPVSLRAEYRMVAADGRVVWVRDEAIFIHDETGKLRMMQGVLHDISEQKHAEEVILSQEATLRKLSIPLLHISEGVLLMPLVGAIDSQRANLMMETILRGVEQERARVVLLDITGVAVVDTQVAQAFVQVAQAIRLLGAQVILTGIRPEVAQTIVELGLNLSMITSHGTLQRGIADALRIHPKHPPRPSQHPAASDTSTPPKPER